MRARWQPDVIRLEVIIFFCVRVWRRHKVACKARVNRGGEHHHPAEHSQFTKKLTKEEQLKLKLARVQRQP